MDPNYPVADDASQYPNRTVSLFPDSVLLGFNMTAVTTSKSFVGLHIGTQFLQVTPTDTSIKPALIRVDVVKPTTLGAYPPFDLDDDISKVASRRGIPPQWIKGHADKESDRIGIGKNVHWDRTTFRYEPLSADLGYVSRCFSGCSKPDREVAPFSRYRFATQTNDGALAVGSDLSADDIAFRTRLHDSDQITFLTATQPDVTAREIFDGNDFRQHWSVVNDIEFKRVEADLKKGKDDLSFNAQTALASSYGLLQCMPDPVARIANWRDPFGPGIADIHPSYLADTSVNLANGTGSLNVATVQLLRLLTIASAGKSPLGGGAFPIDHFDSFVNFRDAWKRALQLYNAGESGYDQDVMSRAQDYTPSLASAGIQP